MGNKPQFFWDTHGFYALLCSDDFAHDNTIKLKQTLAAKKLHSVTTDWIVGETCTLLVMRKHSELVNRYLSAIEQSRAIVVEHVDAELFDEAKQYMLKHLDQGYSFTDCTSFVFMKKLGLKDAVTGDKHFQKAGFNPLL